MTITRYKAVFQLNSEPKALDQPALQATLLISLPLRFLQFPDLRMDGFIQNSYVAKAVISVLLSDEN